MKTITVWICLPVLVMLVVSGVARATPIIEPSNPFEKDSQSQDPRRDRFQVGGYLALWDFAPIDAPGAESESIDASASPLLTLNYLVTEGLSLGGWWNPFRGEIRATVAGSTFKVADLDASFWDLGVTYSLPEKLASGWSIQAGFSQLHYDIDLVRALREVGARNFATTFSSFNFWVNKTQSVGSRRFRRQRHPIRLYGSVGYYTSSQFDRAVNIIVGGTLPLSTRLSLSSSVWFNELGDTNTRMTVGVGGQF